MATEGRNRACFKSNQCKQRKAFLMIRTPLKYRRLSHSTWCLIRDSHIVWKFVLDVLLSSAQIWGFVRELTHITSVNAQRFKKSLSQRLWWCVGVVIWSSWQHARARATPSSCGNAVQTETAHIYFCLSVFQLEITSVQSPPRKVDRTAKHQVLIDATHQNGDV